MKKLLILCFFSLIVISLSFCRKDVNGISEPDQERTIDWVIQNRPQDLVAVTAMFLNEDENKPWKESSAIVFVDFYNTRNYKIITDSSMIAGYPRFSREKRKLIYGDVYNGLYDLGDEFVVYDIKDETFQHLLIRGELPVWDYDATGFFYTKEPSFGFSYIRYYRIDDQHWETISGPEYPPETGYAIVYPVGLKGQDTLIVFSNITEETGQPPGYYFMDFQGNYLSRIDNPYIGKSEQWNNDIGLFVFYEIDTVNGGRKIGVTNLDGSYYRIYTSGQYYDDFPCWGPEGNYILFNRADDIRGTGIPYKLMIIDVQSGEVSEFLKPGDIPGAIKYMYPDF